jgi:16S rRNA (guanine966-N2)-methyltransferase
MAIVEVRVAFHELRRDSKGAVPSMAMRVIAGLYRSRPLAAPRGLSTRPTYDRLRETLFNVLAPRIEGAVFADLYAGSGANGIEALSRRAKQVFFIENAPPALAAIRANLASLGIREGFRIEARSVAAAMQRLAKEGQELDLVFLDPPYESQKEYATTLALLDGECARLLASGAIVIAEHRRREPLAERYGSLTRYRVLEQGDAALSFYSMAE